MNTIITLTGSYNRVFVIKFELKMGYKKVSSNAPEITNHKSFTENSVNIFLLNKK